jgi:hypothetical protein
VRNRFLLRELSVIGNGMEGDVSEKWLREEGFSNVVRLNEVKRIGYMAKFDSNETLSCMIKKSQRFVGQSFSKPIINSNQKLTHLKMSPHHQ